MSTVLSLPGAARWQRSQLIKSNMFTGGESVWTEAGVAMTAPRWEKANVTGARDEKTMRRFIMLTKCLTGVWVSLNYNMRGSAWMHSAAERHYSHLGEFLGHLWSSVKSFQGVAQRVHLKTCTDLHLNGIVRQRNDKWQNADSINVEM